MDRGASSLIILTSLVCLQVRRFELGLKDFGWSCFWYLGVRGKQIERDGVGCSELKLSVRGSFVRENCGKLQTDEAGGRDCPSNRERHSR